MRTKQPITLTTSETAKMLKVEPSRVRQLIAAGRLKAERRGRDWMVDEMSIRDYISGLQATTRKYNVNR